MRSLATARRGGQGRLTAATLLASLLLLLCQAFFSDPAGATTPLPACCRAHGKHFAGMQGECSGRPASQSGLTSVHEKCPYSPLAPSSVHTPSFALSDSSDLLGLATLASASSIQHTPWIPTSFDSSHPKRGPPSAIVLL
ncbi:hypothetical protein [Granulicella sp. dw_53]|uniref:hypothetical protein n=1 Tax=Granulicella sp. dw_53 TaxID=2719792 RepID=UPI001BD6D4E5|nr:hypothetical protein [Granulicella sp. dw_53]